MRIICNNYNSNDIFRIVREWTELTQEQIAKELGYKNYHTIKQIERGVNKYTFDNLLKIAKTHNIKIIIEKTSN